MSVLGSYRAETDGFAVEIDVLPIIDVGPQMDARRADIQKCMLSVDEQLRLCDERIAALNKEIDKLTNHADGLDYAVAVASGILTGLFDTVFVGDYNPSADELVAEFAKRKGCPEGKDPHKYLRDKYKTPNDGAYIGSDGKPAVDILGRPMKTNPHTHRLDDLAHHPTLFGLLSAILVRFLRIGIFSNKDGEFHPVWVETDPKDLIRAWGPVILSGVLSWLANVAERYAEEELDQEIPEPVRKIIKALAAAPALIEVLKCADTWFAHIMSDVGSPKGIPGIFLSFLKELSMLPILNKTKLPELLQEMYKSGQWNFDSDLVMLAKLKKQAIPVMINEIIMRGFYFVRRFIEEYKRTEDLAQIDWEKVVPFNNRTIARMITISSATFMAVDLADAAIRSAVKSGGNGAAFLSNFILRVNFVGVGRCVIAVFNDIGMGIKREKLRNERIVAMGERLALMNAKVYYCYAAVYCATEDLFREQERMWLAAEDNVATLLEATGEMERAIVFYVNALGEISENMQKVAGHLEQAERLNPGLKKEIDDTLKWGEET